MCFAPPVITPVRISHQSQSQHASTSYPLPSPVPQCFRNPYQHPSTTASDTPTSKSQNISHIPRYYPTQQNGPVPIVSAYHAGYAYVPTQTPVAPTPIIMQQMPVPHQVFAVSCQYQDFYGDMTHRAQEELRAIRMGATYQKMPQQDNQMMQRARAPATLQKAQQHHHQQAKVQQHQKTHQSQRRPAKRNTPLTYTQLEDPSDVKTIIDYGKSKKPTTIIPCKFFMKNNGRCKYGMACRFSHVHFWPMPETFSKNEETQEYVKGAVQKIQERDAKKNTPLDEQRDVTSAKTAPLPPGDAAIDTDTSTTPVAVAATDTRTMPDLETTATHYKSLKRSPSSLQHDEVTIEPTPPPPPQPKRFASLDFEWKKALQADSGLIVREAVHYSSESADAPRSKMCSTILQILKESEEYQRIEMICNREENKHAGKILFRPAFVNGQFEIQVTITDQYDDGPVNMPSCIDGIGIKLLRVLPAQSLNIQRRVCQCEV